ncbi:sensor histidine kinase [Amycolatopsis panacis]|nr:HAMP domain-containing sensor histidine kinase [Amycolatopsis panacis]
MKWPAFGLRTRVTAAVVLVTTTATASMAFAAGALQKNEVIGGFTFAAESTFGSVFGQVWPLLKSPDEQQRAFADAVSAKTEEWALFTRGPNGSSRMLNYASTNSYRHPQPSPTRVGDRSGVVATVADQVLVHTADPADFRTATTLDPETGRKLLVVAGNYGNYWMVQFFDLSPVEVGLANQPRQLVYIALGVGVLGVAAALLAARYIQRPVRRVASAARQLGDGAFDVRVPVRGRDELADLAGSFNTMAQRVSESITELRAKDQQQQRFVADVAHDLRTPLASIVATVDNLASTDPELRGRASELLATQSRRLAKLVEDLMEISRFDAGSTDFRPEPIELPALVEDAIEVSAPGSAVRCTATGDATVLADPRRVHTIVCNLLVNAARYGAAPIEVALEGRAEEVVVRVSDAGPGIAEDLLPILFDRFVRGDHSRQTEGSGLGLSIARENALIHGGTLTAHNDGGAVFTLTLPRRTEDASA